MTMPVHKRETDGTTHSISAESGIGERSLKHGTRSKLKGRRQRFARRFMTVDMEDLLVRHLSRSLSKRFIDLGPERISGLSKTMRNTNCP